MRPDTLENNQHSADNSLVPEVIAFKPEIEPEKPEYSPKPTKTNSWLSGGKGLFIGVGLGVLLTLGATRFANRPETAQNPNTQPVAAKNEAPAQTVTTTRVESTPVARTLKATGSVAADELIPILSQATGLQIKEIFVDEGDIVSQGQILARLDDTVLQAQLTQAQANVAQSRARLAELQAGSRKEEIAGAKQTIQRIKAEISQAQSDWDLAKKRVQRNQSLEAEGAIARDRLDEVLNEERKQAAIVQQTQSRLGEAEQQLAQLQAGNRPEVIAQATAQLAEAQSRLAIVKAQLNETRLISPVSGKIAERNARIGDTTNGQNALFKIIENGRLELRLRVPENQLPLIRVGAPVTITSDANSSLKLSGQVREINPIVDEASRQATVKVDLTDNTGLKPGMFLRGAIVTNTSNSLTVPMTAVLPQKDNQALVYLVGPDNTVTAKTVQLGQIMPNNRVEILTGLQAGDRIVVKGAAYLGDGDKITAISDQ